MNSVNTISFYADKFIRSRILSAAVIEKVSNRVYRNRADPKAVYPLVVFQQVDGDDEYVVGGVRLDTQLLYMVRVIQRIPTEGDPDAHDEIAALIDVELDGATDEHIISCTRERPLSRSYVDGEIEYEERGGYYLVEAV